MTLWDALTPGGGDSILVRGHSKHVAAYAKDRATARSVSHSRSLTKGR